MIMVMICHLESIKSLILAGFSGFFYATSRISRLLPGFKMSILAKNMPKVVY